MLRLSAVCVLSILRKASPGTRRAGIAILTLDKAGCSRAVGSQVRVCKTATSLGDKRMSVLLSCRRSS